MRAASEKYAEAVLGSHRVIVKLEVWRGGTRLLDSLPFSDGELTDNGEETVPGDLSLTVPAGAARELTPLDPLAPLAPFGQRVYVRHGIRYPDGSEELLPLGWQQIQSTDPEYLTGALRTTGQSLEVILEESKLTQPRQPPSGATFLSELKALVGTRVLFTQTLPAGVTNRAIPKDRVWEGSRLEALSDLAAAWPVRLKVDDQGVLRILRVVDELSRTPVVTLRTGERGVVASWDAPNSREELYNAVFARGEEEAGDARAVAGYAYDTDPKSPTFYGGPFGERPLEYASPLLTTKAQAEKAARTLLNRRLRRTRTVSVELVPDARLQVDDYVRLETPEIVGVGRIASTKLPLGPGTMSLTLDDFTEDPA